MRFTTAILASITLANTPAGLVGGRSLLDNKKNRVLPSNNRNKVLQSLLSDTQPLWEQKNNGLAKKQQGEGDRITQVRDVNVRECDLDVGILECDKDQVCVPSSHSKRGGICRPRRIGLQPRQLQSPTLCDQFSEELSDPSAGVVVTCNCTYLDYTAMQGLITCVDESWCDQYDPSVCGYMVEGIYMEGSTTPQRIVRCFLVDTEKFCAGYDVESGSTSFSMNGCPCVYEPTTPVVCKDDGNETVGRVVCPYNIIADSCVSYSSLFGNGAQICEAATTVPTVLATAASTPAEVTPTAVPTNPPTQKPIMTEAPTTVVPTSPATQKPNITTEAPTSAPPKTADPSTTRPKTAPPTTPGSKENTTTAVPSNGEEITVNLATIFMAVAVFIGIWI